VLNMKYICMILFCFVLVQGINAQGLFGLYKKYLPEIIRNNPRMQEAESKKLDAYFRLDPYLAAVHLEFLHLFFEKRIADPDSNLKNLEQALYARDMQAQSIWAKDAIKKIKQNMGLNEDQMAALIGIYKPFINEVKAYDTVAFPPQYDANKAEFFQYLYFSENRHTKYQPMEDYLRLKNEELRKQIDNFEDKYNSSDELSRDKRKKFKRKALKYKYIFRASYLDGLNSTSSLDLIEFLQMMMKIQSTDGIKSIPLASKSYLGLLIDAIHYFPNAVDITDPFDFHYTQNMYIPAVFNLFYGVKYHLKDKAGFLSSLNVRGRLAFFNLQQPSGDKEIWLGVKAIYGLSVNGAYHVDAYKNAHYYNASLQATVPILTKGKFEINGGLNLGYRYVVYSYKFYVAGSFVVYNQQLDTDIYTHPDHNETIKGFLINPLIGASYQIDDRYDLSLELILNNAVLLGVAYHLN